MDNPFNNDSKLGSFGEFVYRLFSDKHGYAVERINAAHTDFRLTSNDGQRHHDVDVKSTRSKRNRFSGKRYGEIIYEVISVADGLVSLAPDDKSPFKSIADHENQILIGTLEELLSQWQIDATITNRRKKITSSEVRTDLTIAAAHRYPRLRIIERGDASEKRWKGTLDNFPGSDSVQENHDATVFIEYGFKMENGEITQPVKRVILCPHHIFADKTIMGDREKRQVNKGIREVVDVAAFVSNYPSLVFESIEKLKSHLQSKR